MTNYVAGFLFNANKDSVVLIEKQKPTWQKGRLNGIGGKIELLETPSDAMVREFEEETGVRTFKSDWQKFCIYEWQEGTIHFMYCIDQNYFTQAKTVEKEKILKPLVSYVMLQHKRVIFNLKWLIPLALDPSLNFIKNGPITINE